jgi:hypothetical protein
VLAELNNEGPLLRWPGIPGPAARDILTPTADSPRGDRHTAVQAMRQWPRSQPRRHEKVAFNCICAWCCGGASGWWTLPTPGPGRLNRYDAVCVWSHRSSRNLSGLLADGEQARPALVSGCRWASGAGRPDHHPGPTQTPAAGITFGADRTQFKAGECVTFAWQVDNRKGVSVWRGERWQVHSVAERSHRNAHR